MRSTLSSLVLAALACAACSSDDQTSRDDGPGPNPMPPTEEPIGPEEPTVEPVNGTMPCEPLNSGFAGDDLCVLPPEPGTGVHLHVGPTDYDDPDQIAEFVVAAGTEPTDNYVFNTTNDVGVTFYEQHYRMRPGSHHLIIHLLTRQVEEPGWVGTRLESGLDAIQIGGTQRSNFDFPPGGEIPPEDANLGRPVGAHAGMSFELHYVNATDSPLLREAWVNFMQTDAESVSLLGGVFMIGARFEIPPGAHQTLNYTSDPLGADTRIVSVFGHRHASTERFSVWAHHGGERTLIYEDYDWEEPAELLYNSVIDNGSPDPDALTPGGYSGILQLNEGDRLEWECEVQNASDGVLTFGNEVYTAEMCNLFGSQSGGASPILFGFPPLVLK